MRRASSATCESGGTSRARTRDSSPAGAPARERGIKQHLTVRADLTKVATDARSEPRNGHRAALVSRQRAVVGLAAAAVAGIGPCGQWSRLAAPLPRGEYTQVTHFADSATSPALSPDGRLLTFIRGNSTFEGPGQIYLKELPDGDPVQLTSDRFEKMGPVFSPDGSRIAYTSRQQRVHLGHVDRAGVRDRTPRSGSRTRQG